MSDLAELRAHLQSDDRRAEQDIQGQEDLRARKVVINQPGSVVVSGGRNTIEVHVTAPRGDPLRRV